MNKAQQFSQISKCRACGSSHLQPLFGLGNSALTGQFPQSCEVSVQSGPLDLVMCGNTECNLVQLLQTYDLNQMYGENYGYMSSLNASMIKHLKEKKHYVDSLSVLNHGDLVLDIGSNDGTTLNFYEPNKYKLFGIDPSAGKFRDYYNKDIDLIVDFFGSYDLQSHIGVSNKFKVITSYSMFYDLEHPVEFAQEINSILDYDGIWVLEQSYLPTMLHQFSYDTICHEHLEYYGLKQLVFILDKAKLRIFDFSFNDVNGGSISISVCKKDSSIYPVITNKISQQLSLEKVVGIDNPQTFNFFQTSINNNRDHLTSILENAKKSGLKCYGLGASTKGNTILQYCGITSEHLIAIGEVNSDKYGCFTPGSNIPIIEESKCIDDGDLFLVLPWHFRNFFLNLPKLKGKLLLFPMPNCEIVLV